MIDESGAEESFSTDKSRKTPSGSVTISKSPATDPVDDSRNNFFLSLFFILSMQLTKIEDIFYQTVCDIPRSNVSSFEKSETGVHEHNQNTHDNQKILKQLSKN